MRGRLARLRCMTAAEIAWRVLRALQARAERSRLNDSLVVPAPDLAATPNPWFRLARDVKPDSYCAAADRIAEGWFDVYALRGIDLGTPPRWNRDPKSGIEAPAMFGKLLDIGNPDLVGDIKYVWQPNRHAHLVTLAQAFALTRRRRYLDALQESVESWLFACPYAVGPNWSSALEAAVRLGNWASAWQLVGVENLEGLFRDRWLRSVYQHCEFIRGWFTLHASAGHRLVGEAAGLFLGALAWPYWRESRGWAATAKAILEREAVAQTSPDGVSREQSTALHAFVLERLILCLLAGKANGQWFSPDYESRIEAMLDFLASIMDARGNVPMLGDADAEDPASGAALCRALLATGAVLFKRGDFKLKARRLDERNRWLLGAAAEREFAELDTEKTRLPLRQAFPEGGYFIIGCGFDSPQEIRVVADAGPLGFRAAAAHGHADALSFTLSAGGRELLIDPGSYAWHTQAAWRRYFRGTAAHNALRIDGLDQSEPGGRFLWLEKARAGCSLWLSSPEKDSFEGWH
ncbi:MAG: Heparinase family protein, partial [Burkholderiales bacterium]|nr:Heparinase family protein [Burkholderiales bacterium]